MFKKLNEFICLSLALSVFLTVTARAQQTVPVYHPNASASAPVPSQVLSARKVFVTNGGGSNYFNLFTGGADRAYNSFYAELGKTGDYDLVDSPAQADVVLQVKAIAPLAGDGDSSAALLALLHRELVRSFAFFCVRTVRTRGG